MQVCVLLVPGVMGSSALGMLDVLTTASFLLPAEYGSLHVLRVATDGAPVLAFQGIPLPPDATLASVTQADLVLLPSVALDTQRWFEGQGAVMDWLRQQAAGGARMASVCTGSFLLAEAGLLDGKTATTHWAFASHFRQRYPTVTLETHAALLHHGPIMTAGAGMAWQDLLLQALQGMLPDPVLLQLRETFLLQVHTAGQQPFIGLAPAEHNDRLIRTAQQWLRETLAQDDAIAQAIHRSGLQQRTFQRRFRQACGMSAVQYLQQLRIDAAKLALVQGTLPVEDVGFAVGYNDSSFFRRLFRRHTGLTPAAYRRLNHAATVSTATTTPA